MATTEEVAAWKHVIEDQERGDETQGEFCARRGPKLGTFRNRKHRLARFEGESRPSPMSFAPFKLVDCSAETASGVELDLGGERG